MSRSDVEALKAITGALTNGAAPAAVLPKLEALIAKYAQQLDDRSRRDNRKTTRLGRCNRENANL